MKTSRLAAGWFYINGLLPVIYNLTEHIFIQLLEQEQVRGEIPFNNPHFSILIQADIHTDGVDRCVILAEPLGADP